MLRGIRQKQSGWQTAFCLLFAMTSLLWVSPESQAEVVTSLSAPSGQVGVPLQLQYQFVTVGQPADMPRSLMVDGLEIRLTGASQRTEIVNMQASSMAIFSYTIIPSRPGNFTIPSFSVNCSQTQPPTSQQVRTPTVAFRVGASNGSRASDVARPSPSTIDGLSDAAKQPPNLPRKVDGDPEHYFGEIVGKTNDVVVGELIPIELRYYFRADCQFDNLQRPTLSADRVINGPVGEPVQSETYIEDVPYNAVTFQSFLVPAAPGRVSINSSMEGRMTVPVGVHRDFFLNFTNLGAATNIVATAVGELLVRDLPLEGQPANFGGAVGQFAIEAIAAPVRLKVGETAKVSVTVSGTGNFLAVDAASLLDSAIWKILSSESSSATNGIDNVPSGPKTILIEAQALAPMGAGPAATLVFFNPSEGQYQKIVGGSVSVTANED